MRDSGPVPKDQLRKMADIFINDMGITPEEVLQKPEFIEQGITDLAQLEEGKMKITKHQLRKIIREEVSRLNETRPRHGIDPREFGRKVIHLRDGRSGIVVAVTRDIILFKSGEQIIPGQVDWPKTNRT
jgi:hypothetical protein